LFQANWSMPIDRKALKYFSITVVCGNRKLGGYGTLMTTQCKF
jgi:hypothetical protein